MNSEVRVTWIYVILNTDECSLSRMQWTLGDLSPYIEHSEIAVGIAHKLCLKWYCNAASMWSDITNFETKIFIRRYRLNPSYGLRWANEKTKQTERRRFFSPYLLEHGPMRVDSELAICKNDRNFPSNTFRTVIELGEASGYHWWRHPRSHLDQDYFMADGILWRSLISEFFISLLSIRFLCGLTKWLQNGNQWSPA